jgi:hypothetical protein
MEVQQDFRELFALFDVISQEFIHNKISLGRKKDLADIEALGEE